MQLLLGSLAFVLVLELHEDAAFFGSQAALSDNAYALKALKVLELATHVYLHLVGVFVRHFRASLEQVAQLQDSWLSNFSGHLLFWVLLLGLRVTESLGLPLQLHQSLDGDGRSLRRLLNALFRHTTDGEPSPQAENAVEALQSRNHLDGLDANTDSIISLSVERVKLNLGDLKIIDTLP